MTFTEQIAEKQIELWNNQITVKQESNEEIQ